MNYDPQNPNSPPQLAIHEWFAVLLILAVMALITGISLLSDTNKTTETQAHHLKPQYFEVLIQGAVQHPGSYSVKSGSTMQTVLDKALPLENADLNRIKSQTKLRNGQVINIPIMQKITVFIEGAVEFPGELQVPQGTMIKDLHKYTKMAFDANFDALKPTRKLKAGDKIIVPRKKTEKSRLQKNRASGRITALKHS
jgi:protein involved in polysaccharide export with SLBB domain